MISPSRRRRSVKAKGSDAYTLHLVTARRMALDRRALRAAVCGLAGALLGAALSRFIDVPLVAHLGLMLAAGALGAALPVPRLERAALDTIADQAGLAYESGLTVLESRADGAPTDDFGLAPRVLEAGARSVLDYRRPPTPAWWLPAAVLAAAVIALTYAFPVVGTRAVAAQGPATSLAQEQGDSVDQPMDRVGELTGQPEAANRAEGAGTPEQLGRTVDDRDALPPGTEPGNDALSRFLESLRQGESSPGATPRSGAGEGSGTGDGADGAPGPTNETQAQGRSPDSPRSGGDSGAGNDAGQDETGTEPGGETAATSQAATDAGSEDDVDESMSGSPTAGRDPRERAGEGEEDRRLSEGDEAAGAGGGQQRGDDARGGGEGGASGGEEGASEAGAVGVGGTTLDDSETADGPAFAAGGVELLPGVVQTGPTNPAGRVRLPGSSEVELPAGTPLAPYAEAAEEAVGEGDLPAGYQEIIRRYFQ